MGDDQEEVLDISSDTEDEGDSSEEESADDKESNEEEEEESADDNENNTEEEEPASPVRKRMKPSGDEINNAWKESVEANHVAKLPLWGVPGVQVFNIGAQYVEGLVSSKGFKDFAGAGTKHFKEFKEELALVKSWTWSWGRIPTSKRETKMEESGSKMKVSLCKAVANFRVALSGATDPGNMIYKEEAEDEKEENLRIKKIVARNLLVSLSYLIPRVVPSTRLALYVECAQVHFLPFLTPFWSFFGLIFTPFLHFFICPGSCHCFLAWGLGRELDERSEEEVEGDGGPAQGRVA